MKFLPLLWSGIWRKPARAVLAMVQIMVAFALFGLLQGFSTGVKQALAGIDADVLSVHARGSFSDLPLAHYAPLMSSRTSMDGRARADDKQLQQDALNAAILHTQAIAAASAAGGQIVTEKIRFGRKDEHALRVVVDFNGEQHQFDFAAPPAK
jgi:hypothetical protein